MGEGPGVRGQGSRRNFHARGRVGEGYAYPMADKDKASGMKSAYELALERMEQQGISKPREEALGEEALQEIGEARRQAEAKLAELEILHRDRLRAVHDPAKRKEDEEEYVRERRRIEEGRDRKIEKLREPG